MVMGCPDGMVIRTQLLLGNPLSRGIVRKGGVWRAKRIDRLIGKYLEQEYKVLDFGAGDCIISCVPEGRV